jgi:hypothetical protein
MNEALQLMALLVIGAAVVQVVVNQLFDLYDHYKNPLPKLTKEFWNLQIAQTKKEEGTYDHRKKQKVSRWRSRRWAV